MWYWTCDECNNENPCINDTCELCGKKWSASTAAEIQKKKKEHEAEIAQLKKQIAIDKANEGREEQKRVALEKNRLHSAIFYSQMTDFIKKGFCHRSDSCNVRHFMYVFESVWGEKKSVFCF